MEIGAWERNPLGEFEGDWMSRKLRNHRKKGNIGKGTGWQNAETLVKLTSYHIICNIWPLSNWIVSNWMLDPLLALWPLLARVLRMPPDTECLSHQSRQMEFPLHCSAWIENTKWGSDGLYLVHVSLLLLSEFKGSFFTPSGSRSRPSHKGRFATIRKQAQMLHKLLITSL